MAGQSHLSVPSDVYDLALESSGPIATLASE